jgi:RNA polymerase sigma-54 factor
VKADTRSGEAVAEFDWESYLENQSAAPADAVVQAQQRGPPSLEATLTRGTSLFDHLEWQLKLSRLSPQEEAVRLLIIGNLTPDGYLDSRSTSCARSRAPRRLRRGGA